MDFWIKEMDERVLETAGRLFAELGYDGTSMELVAAVAGLHHLLDAFLDFVFLHPEDPGARRYFRDEMHSLVDRLV